MREFKEGTDVDVILKHGHPDHLFTYQTGGTSSYVGTKHMIPQDYRYDEIYAVLKAKWESDIPRWTQYFARFMDDVMSIARKHNCHVGSTEGWGIVNWAEHPLLDWDIHRGTAEICAKLGAEKGYLFNCSANFCHPHFLGFWENRNWHRQLTGVIKSGTPKQLNQA